jgi:formylglycine-generating enzyme required for sulfatase activity
MGPILNERTTVGSYRPNAFGLFDMNGNVAEWCWDYYDKDFYSKSPEADPTGPSSAAERVLRAARGASPRGTRVPPIGTVPRPTTGTSASVSGWRGLRSSQRSATPLFCGWDSNLG